MASAKTNTTQKRSRTTAEQLSRMVDFLGEHPGLAGSKFLKQHGKQECDKKWGELAAMLNSLGGSVKNVEQWRTVWRDLKSRTTIKVRERNRQRARTGNHPIYEDRTSEMERRVLAIIGNDYAEGDGFPPENMPEKEEHQLRMEEDDMIQLVLVSHDGRYTSSPTPNTPARNDNTPSPTPTTPSPTPTTPGRNQNMRSPTPITPASQNYNMTPSTPYTSAQKTPRSVVKRKRTESGSDLQNKFLEIAQTQASALKILADANAAIAESSCKQADALKLLAETSAESVQATKSLAEAMNTMGGGLKDCAEAFTNLTNAIYRA